MYHLLEDGNCHGENKQISKQTRKVMEASLGKGFTITRDVQRQPRYKVTLEQNVKVIRDRKQK